MCQVGLSLGWTLLGGPHRLSQIGFLLGKREIHSATEVELSSPRSLLARPAEMVPFRPCCQAQAHEICVGTQCAQAILRAALPCSWSQASGGTERLNCRIIISTLSGRQIPFCSDLATASSLLFILPCQ